MELEVFGEKSLNSLPSFPSHNRYYMGLRLGYPVPASLGGLSAVGVRGTGT